MVILVGGVFPVQFSNLGFIFFQILIIGRKHPLLSAVLQPSSTTMALAFSLIPFLIFLSQVII